MRFRRAARLLVPLIIVVVLALGGGAIYLVRRPFPQIRGDLAVAGLAAPVDVIRDRWGIPHIYAQNTHDLFFAQGYVHAQDRLWQMEVFRRTSAGRLSEIFGPVTLGVDRFMRVLGLRRAAAAAWSAAAPAGADPAVAAMVEAARAYSDGVNAFLDTHRQRLPLEFTILRVQPEPWTPVDSLAYGKLMAYVLGGNWRAELLRRALAARFGPDGAAALLPEQFPGSPTIIEQAGRTGVRAAGPRAPALPGEALPIPPWPSAFPFTPLLAGESGRFLAGESGAGSNNWVLAPGRSQSGGALLANDPHLDAQMPSIWHVDHLSGGPYDVIGVAFPGVPGIVIGHNRDIAWGLTNAEEDAQDLYLERFHPRDPNLYLFRGQWVRAQVEREEIRIKGRAEAETLDVRITRHGPILNPVVEGLDAFVALRWTALDPDRIFAALLGVNRARSWEEFRAALRDWAAPSQNFVYADRAGNIGYVMPGRIPLRVSGHDGREPVPGWSGEFEWQGFVPADQLPAVLNPPRGYIVTSNNRVAPADYPYVLGSTYDIGVRAARVTALLDALPRAGLDDLARIQVDQTSLLAQRFLAAWQDVRIADRDLAPLFDEVKRWDGRVAADSRPALVYEGLLLILTRDLFADALGPEVFRQYRRSSQAPALVLLDLSARADDPWWRGGRDAMMTDALRQTVRDLERRLGSDRSTWRWGRVHTAALVHPLGRVPALSWIFNGPAPATGGDHFTVNVGSFDPEAPYRQTVVSSMRLLVDAKDWTARIVHTTGQSGLPFHRHYRDLTTLWARGDYVPLVYERAAITAAQEGVLRLTPP